MATLLNNGDHNFVTNGAWQNVESGTNAIQTTISGVNNSTTSYQWSSAFTVTNGKNIDGVCLHIKQTGSPTSETCTIVFSVDGSAETKTVVVNAADLPIYASWCFFKFDSAHTSSGEATYKVGFKTSVNTKAVCYGSTTNLARLCRRSDAGDTVTSPSADDIIYVCGEYTGAGTNAVKTVTMNSTSTTTGYGNITIGAKGKLVNGTTAATAYAIKVTGSVYTYCDGELDIGVSGTAIPSDSSASWLLNCSSACQYGIYVYDGGTFKTYGATKTVSTYLASDYSSGTSLTTSSSTSWLNGETIAVATTSTSATQSETKTLGADASGTTLTLSSGLSNSHSGTAPTRAEIINLNRNVKIYGASSSNTTFIQAEGGAVVSIYYAEMYYMAKSGTPVINIATDSAKSGSFEIKYSCIHDCTVASSIAIRLNSANTAPSVTITNNALYNITSTFITSNSGTFRMDGLTISDNIMIHPVASGTIITFASYPSLNSSGSGLGTFSGNTIVGGATCVSLVEPFATFTNNTFHAAANYGFTTASAWLRNGGTFSGNTSWRNGYGMYIPGGAVFIMNMSTWTMFGNSNFHGSIQSGVCNYYDCDFQAGTGTTTSAPFVLYNMGVINLYYCDIGTTTSFSNMFSWQGTSIYKISVVNCGIGLSSTLVGNQSSMKYAVDYVDVQRYNTTANDNRTYLFSGNLTTDAVIHTTTSTISERLTPNTSSTAAYPLESKRKKFMVTSGSDATITVAYRRSASGDSSGADYTGGQPRLILKANPACGVNADVVIATATGTTKGSWLSLSGTLSDASVTTTTDAVLEFVVDCDGTGNANAWISVADFTIAAA